MAEYTHFDASGNAIMVNVGEKAITHREATASGRITMSRECFLMVKEGTSKKGDVLTVAQVAGIMAVKKTSELIPLCHPLQVTKVNITFELLEEAYQVKTTATVCVDGKTGVEMEALTGVQVALLTIYDMCKAVDRAMEITQVHLEEKSGGKSGHFIREEL